MKKSMFLSFILTFCITYLFAQDYKPWNVSLNFTSYFRNVIIAPAVSRSFGERFEIGFMPVFQYFKRKPSDSYNYKQTSFGLNITGRYFLGRGEVMDPYVSGLIGYGFSDEEGGFSGPPANLFSVRTNFFDIVVLLGNEVTLGHNGWIFDFNVGLLGTKFYADWRDFEVLPIYSFGIKKKFGSK